MIDKISFREKNYDKVNFFSQTIVIIMQTAPRVLIKGLDPSV